MAGVDPKLAAKFDDRLDPWYYRYGKVFWHDSGYSMSTIGDEHIFDSERMLTLIKQEILDGGPARGIACLWAGERLARWRDSRDVFTFLFTQRRAPNATGSARTFPQQAGQADQHLAALDKRRAAVIRKFYQQEWCSRGLYHMLLNSCMGFDAMIEAVQGVTGLATCPGAADVSAASSL